MQGKIFANVVANDWLFIYTKKTRKLQSNVYLSKMPQKSEEKKDSSKMGKNKFEKK